MKLRTKMTCISSLVIFFALLCCNLLIHRICSTAMLEEATQTAYIETTDVKKSFDQYASQLKGDVDANEVRYYFKIEQDDYTVCVKNDTELFNNTVLSLAELRGDTYQNHLDLTYKAYTVAERNILIFKTTSFMGHELYHIADITHVYQKIRMLAVTIFCISVGVLFISVAGLSVLLKHSLAPLSELSEGAKGIASGAYDKRVPVKGRDEIGILAGDFNTMAEAVERHAKELEKSEERKTLFVGNLTHELKTPLTAISGYAQTMRTVALSDEDKAEALAYIYAETGRLDRLSKKMMRLLELECDTEIIFWDIPIKELFAASVRSCQGTANAKSITLDIGKCEGFVQGDFDLMCDVLINLVDNAIKASEEGASVKLYTENSEMVVEDFGCGIPEAEIAKITEPFYMVDKSRSRKSGGAGLGLALTKLILSHHGMEMCIESTLGKGTRVRVYKSFATR